jgi:hypothetical protein
MDRAFGAGQKMCAGKRGQPGKTLAMRTLPACRAERAVLHLCLWK